MRRLGLALVVGALAPLTGGVASVASASTASAAAPGVTLSTVRAHQQTPPAYSVSLPYPQLVGTSFAVQAINARLRADAYGVESGFFRELAAFGPAPAGAARPAVSSLFGGITTDIATARFVGFTTEDAMMPAGAAHPTAAVLTRTFDVRTGSPLALGDLFRTHSDYLSVLARESRALLRPQLGQLLDPVMFDPGTTPQAANFAGWALTPFGLRVTFGEYQVAAYAAGTPTIVIPWSALAGVARPGGPLSQAAAHGPVHMQLLPAAAPSVAPLCDAPLALSDSAIPRPLTCHGGAINVEAWNSFAGGAPGVLALGRRATPAEVHGASCRALQQMAAQAPYVRAAVGLAGAYEGWHFARSPLAGFPADCKVPGAG